MNTSFVFQFSSIQPSVVPELSTQQFCRPPSSPPPLPLSHRHFASPHQNCCRRASWRAFSPNERKASQATPGKTWWWNCSVASQISTTFRPFSRLSADPRTSRSGDGWGGSMFSTRITPTGESRAECHPQIRGTLPCCERQPRVRVKTWTPATTTRFSRTTVCRYGSGCEKIS